MFLAGRADETVVSDAHAVPQRAIFRSDRIGPLLGTLSSRRGRAFDFLTVLVGASEEKGV